MAIKQTIFGNSRCGCVSCKSGFTTGASPVTSKSFWMGQRNKHNRSFGRFRKK